MSMYSIRNIADWKKGSLVVRVHSAMAPVIPVVAAVVMVISVVVTP